MEMCHVKFLVLATFTLLFCCPSRGASPESGAHYLHLPDSEALQQLLRYDKAAPVIIQGHRGARENGLPESSIAAFEYVLEHTSAIFEIDPRWTKDRVVVVFHDPKLDRTTNGVGNVADYTWAELQQLNLKNAKGELTPYKIPTLAEVLEWARGKTALILDKKDVPPEVIAEMIRAHDAAGYVINMARTPEEAVAYYQRDPRRVFAVSIRTPEAFSKYLKAGIPAKQMFACIGTQINEQTERLCRLMRKKGVRCLLATATTYDKLKTPQERQEAYRQIVACGVTMLESNYPTEVRQALSPSKVHRPETTGLQTTN